MYAPLSVLYCTKGRRNKKTSVQSIHGQLFPLRCWLSEKKKRKLHFFVGKGMCRTQPHCIQVWMLEHRRQSRRVKTYDKVSIHSSAFQTTLDD